MDDDFKNIELVMPELMKDIEDIKSSVTTIEQSIITFAKYIQERLGLYSAIVTQIDGDKEIFQAAFSSDKTYSERLVKRLPVIQSISSDLALTRFVSNGQIIFATETSQQNFSPLFMETASDVWLPVKKENRVIGIIKLGSRKIIQIDKQEKSDNSKLLLGPYEKLLEKFSEILESNNLE